MRMYVLVYSYALWKTSPPAAKWIKVDRLRLFIPLRFAVQVTHFKTPIFFEPQTRPSLRTKFKLLQGVIHRRNDMKSAWIIPAVSNL